jgi:hypothetical protein
VSLVDICSYLAQAVVKLVGGQRYRLVCCGSRGQIAEVDVALLRASAAHVFSEVVQV